jgi:hypothetical protein
VVLGATFEIKSRLKELNVPAVYVDGPVDAMDAVLTNPDAVLAYAPGVFGSVCAGQPVKVVSASRSLVLITKALPEAKPAVLRAGEFQQFVEDPEVLARQAAMTLRAKLLLCLDTEEAGRTLQALLLDIAPLHVTSALRSA